MNPITFQKATITTDNETTEGVLVIANDPAITSLDEFSIVKIPKKIFVPTNDIVFYTNDDVYLNDIIFEKCKFSDMLELLSLVNLEVPFIDYYFFDEISGFIINFYQPDQKYQGRPVYIQLIEPIEWINHWDIEDTKKNQWITAMINKNPPEIIKNKLLLTNI